MCASTPRLITILGLLLLTAVAFFFFISLLISLRQVLRQVLFGDQRHAVHDHCRACSISHVGPWLL